MFRQLIVNSSHLVQYEYYLGVFLFVCSADHLIGIFDGLLKPQDIRGNKSSYLSCHYSHKFYQVEVVFTTKRSYQKKSEITATVSWGCVRRSKKKKKKDEDK